jgi:hypothetical protein
MIRDLALVIDGAPKVQAPAADLADHLIEMPARRGEAA